MIRFAGLAALLFALSPLADAQVATCTGGDWSNGATHVAGIGSNRLLVVAIGGEANVQGANVFSGVTYGGQALTLFVDMETAAAGFTYVGTLWYLDEAGLAAATNSTIVVTATGPAFVDTTIAAVTYCNVNQVNPIGNTTAVESSGATTVDPITASINIEAGNAGIAATGVGNAFNYAWLQDVTEQTDFTDTSSTWSTADRLNYATTGTKTAEADFLNNVNRNVLLFAEIERFQPAPVAEFSGTPLSGVRPLAVSFTDASTGMVTSYAWTFGDTGSSTLQNPTHTYTAAGTYTVSLTVTGPGGSDTEIETDYISVQEQAPVAEFSGTPTSGVRPLTVAFSDTSFGVVTSYAWIFGDSGASSLPNPSHTYTLAGTYTVSLTVTGPGGSDSETKLDYITVQEPAPSAAFSGTPTSGLLPLLVTFTDATTGPVSAWAWTFGDGASSALQSPTHTYNTSGTYTVSLTATGPGGSDAEVKSDYITAGNIPITAEFSGSPLSGVEPLNVSFSDLSLGSPSAWSWTFGDGGSATSQNPTHTFTAGTYTITLMASGPGGVDTETKSDYITVSVAAPVAEFSGSPANGVAPLSVSFTDLSTGAVSSWSWNFGDAGASNLQNPTHVYTTIGTYTVSLTATGAGGSNVETKTDYITVTDQIIAEFSGTPSIGSSPLTVNFTDLSSGGVSGWTWSFGDSNGSLLQNPVNTYLSTGTYTVTLSVTGPTGSDSEIKTDYIVVIGPTDADFSASPLSGTVPLTVSFTDTTTPPASSWSWDFGDMSSSTAQNPTHIYTSPGTYSVALTANSPGGVDTEVKIDLILVQDSAASTYRNGSGVNPACYSSPPPIIGQTWTAEVDSTAMEGTIATVIYVRMNPLPGTPTVSGEILVDPGGFLFDSVVISSGGVDQHIVPLPNDLSLAGRPGYTQALLFSPDGSQFANAADVLTGFEPQIARPAAAFSAAPTTGNAPLTVAFTDGSTGAMSSWIWDFGDGNCSGLQHPSHTYATYGTYAISLVVEGPGGYDLEFKADYVTVLAPPVAEFDATPQAGAAPLTVAFSDLSTGSVTSWSWVFGDTGSSTVQNPTYTYNVSGTYTVSLTASGPLGVDVETKLDYIAVGNTPPMAEFSATPLSGLAPLVVSFTGLSTGVVTGWSWDFGDTGSSTLENPTHTYGSAGTFTVSLTSSGPGGFDTETKLDYISVIVTAPVAEFTGSPLLGNQPLAVSFTDLTSGGVSSWSWTFGDGGTSSMASPSHTYVLFGTYTVSLTATGPGGSDGETKPAYVVVLPPIPQPDFSASPTAGMAPLAVAFTDLSVGLVTSWSWDFGDGGSSSQQHPGHTYLAPGTFTVSLTTSGTGGSATETKVDLVSVLAGGFVDGSFELQSAGAAPSFPWLVTSGSGHIIQPDSAVVSDNGMPADGANWAEVSSAGTSGALPPGNPGGAGALPIGAAGFAQTFAFDPIDPVLVVRAAFILAGPAAAAGANDFMSVDISDGTTHHNVYYADTFSAFPNTSSRHGLPMTAVTSLGVNLQVLFPAAVLGTALTLSVEAGNGGGAADSSLGYVDDFFLRNTASITYRNGSGINPPCFVAGPPTLGQPWIAQVDHRDRPGATVTVVRLFTMGHPGIFVPGFGELLTTGFELFQFVGAAHPSGVATHSFPVPLQLSFMGMSSSQGLILGTPSDQTFCNALDLRIGFETPDPQPAAGFGADVTLGPAPLTVLFTDLSTGVITDWNWDFGDGSSSTQQSPGHIYSTPGTYTVGLRVTGPGGLDIERKFDHIVAQ